MKEMGCRLMSSRQREGQPVPDAYLLINGKFTG